MDSLSRHQKKRALKAAAKAEKEAGRKLIADRANEWIGKINEADSPEDVYAVGNCPVEVSPFDNNPSLESAIAKYRRASKQLNRKRTIKLSIEAYGSSPNANSARRLVNEYSCDYFDEVLEGLGIARDEFGAHITNLLLRDLQAVRSGDVDALERFLEFKFAQDDDPGFDAVLESVLDEDQYNAIELPDDWNDLVATMIKVPDIDYFAREEQEYTPADVRLMGAEALTERSLTLAKFVLAFCTEPEFCQVVGDLMIKELAVMVYNIHVERGLFVD